VVGKPGRQVPIRIGVNAGSLPKSILAKHGRPTPEAMVESALEHIRLFEHWGTIKSRSPSSLPAF
jgi:4-hydroxy-3-methylbut-2-en-1-yl diphosphate synthase IspG/GcpE